MKDDINSYTADNYDYSWCSISNSGRFYDYGGYTPSLPINNGPPRPIESLKIKDSVSIVNLYSDGGTFKQGYVVRIKKIRSSLRNDFVLAIRLDTGGVVFSIPGNQKTRGWLVTDYKGISDYLSRIYGIDLLDNFEFDNVPEIQYTISEFS